jgi:hypothetical protein
MPSFDPKDYVQVNERLEKFRAEHPTWGLVSDLIHQDETRVIVRAVITDESGREIASGMAEEVRGSSPVNKTSAVENGETSAWGRALANLGYEVKRSIASREEMEKVDRMQRSATSATAPPDPIKVAQSKAIAVIGALSKPQRTALRQLLAKHNVSQDPDKWKDEATFNTLKDLIREARKAPADPEPVEATA